MSTDGEQFWFNLLTHTVERGPQSLSAERVGPFESAEEAARALETIRRKAAEIRREDDTDW